MSNNWCLEDSDGSARYESVKRTANNWIMMNSTGRADMELGTMGHGGDKEDNDQDKKKVRFDYDSDASTSCGSECTEKCELDPNLVGILLSSSSESEPLCEMSSEWAPMPQPLVIDNGAAEAVTPRTWLPNHKTVDSEGSTRGVFILHDGRTAALWKTKERIRCSCLHRTEHKSGK